MNYSNRPLDIPTAVEYISNMLYLKKGFFVMTDMGRIAIEGVLETDPVNPVSIHKWESSIKTEWRIKNHNEMCDYYVQIGIHPDASYEYLYMLSIQAVMAVKLYHAVHYHVIQQYIDALTFSFVQENERDPEFFISRIEKEFMDIHCVLKPNKMSVELAHYMIRDRLAKAVALLNSANNKYISRVEESAFNRDMLAIIYDLRMTG